MKQYHIDEFNFLMKNEFDIVEGEAPRYPIDNFCKNGEDSLEEQVYRCLRAIETTWKVGISCVLLLGEQFIPNNTVSYPNVYENKEHLLSTFVAGEHNPDDFYFVCMDYKDIPVNVEMKHCILAPSMYFKDTAVKYKCVAVKKGSKVGNFVVKSSGIVDGIPPAPVYVFTEDVPEGINIFTETNFRFEITDYSNIFIVKE